MPEPTAAFPALWRCRNCDWSGLKASQHEQETEDETGHRHWTLCPPPSGEDEWGFDNTPESDRRTR